MSMSGERTSLLDEFLETGRPLRLEWRERAEQPLRRCGEEACTSTAGPGTELPTSTDAGFIAHKVTKLDTLAGLAIKYSVPISDIKRFNGLMSDSALHGLDCVLIPTNLQPVSEEVSAYFAQIATGLGRDPAVRSEPGMHTMAPSTSGLLRLESGERPWWCVCGMCADDGADVARTCPNVHHDESTSGSLLATSECTGPTRVHEQMRRRYQPSKTGEDECHDAGPGADTYSLHDERSLCSPVVEATAAALLSSFGKKVSESGSALVQKLKEVASRPSSHNWGHHNVLSSLRQGLMPKGNLSTGRQDRAQLCATPSLASQHKLGHKRD